MTRFLSISIALLFCCATIFPQQFMQNRRKAFQLAAAASENHPTNIANCSAFWDARYGYTLNGTEVTNWVDVVGGIAASNRTANTPNWSANTIQFNGSTDWLMAGAASASRPYHILVGLNILAVDTTARRVIDSPTPAVLSYIRTTDGHTLNAGNAMTAGTALTGKHLLEYIVTAAGAAAIWTNGILSVSNAGPSVGANNLGGFYMLDNSGHTRNLNADLQFIGIYSSVLSQSSRESLSNWWKTVWP